MKTVGEMSKKELQSVPHLSEWQEEIRCHSFVVIPGSGSQKQLHDSGFRCMSFVAVDRKEMPICQVGGGSDVIHIDGITGFGHRWLDKYKGCPTEVKPTSWSVDCLPRSGLLRFFASEDVLLGAALSSFEVFSVSRESEKESP